jgi:transposase
VEVRVMHRQGQSVRSIARELGCSRNTVRRYLREARAGRYGPRAPRRCKLDPYKAYVLERVDAARPHWIPATVLLREIAGRGYGGGISRLKAFLAPLKSLVTPTRRIRVSRSANSSSRPSTPACRLPSGSTSSNTSPTWSCRSSTAIASSCGPGSPLATGCGAFRPSPPSRHLHVGGRSSLGSIGPAVAMAAVAFRKNHPNVPAFDILDVCMRQRSGRLADFGEELAQGSTFEALVMEAFGPALTRDEALDRFVERHGLSR